MWTVYEIRLQPTGECMYVGCTSKPLAERLRQHISDQGTEYLTGATSDNARRKAEMMDMARAGEVLLTIHPLAIVFDKELALAVERAAVGLFAPPLNASLYEKTPLPPIEPGDVRLTYKEAASKFNYTYQTIRFMVCKGHVRTVDGRIPMGEMLRYIQNKKISGRPQTSKAAA